ncbi:hypothetical protein ACP70R_026261 [Stipagrostis hirtigluma subsp. patula]
MCKERSLFSFAQSMMSILSLLCVVLLSIAFLPEKHVGRQHYHTTKERNDGLSSLPKKNDKITSGDVHAVLATIHTEISSIQVSHKQAHPSDDDSDEVVYLAAHGAIPGKPYNEYFGFVATIDVYAYNISQGQESSSSVWIVNLGDGSKERYNSIRVGWMVSPKLYGDSHTHFYTHWNGDGYDRSGCYNIDCPGFQLEKGSNIAPGAIIAQASAASGASTTITVKVFKEKSTGKWWVYCGINNGVPTAVGYYPANLFAGLATKADGIGFGGVSAARRSLPTPPMGNGFLPSENAASISNLQFVDQDGQSTPISIDLPIVADNPRCYYVSPIIGAKFFYGGPAGCF